MVQLTAARPHPHTRRRKRRGRQTLTALALLSPLLALMGVFVFYPLVNTIRLSLFEYHFQTGQSKFVGGHNYVRWAHDHEMWASAWVSLKFFLYYVPASVVIAFFLALGIHRVASKWFAGLYRTIFFFPVVLPAAIVFNMWINLYDPTYGLFASLGQDAGVGSLNWLGNPHLALPGIAIMSIWRLIGETMVLLLVGLANIPKDYVDAARIDGAGEWQIIRRIILPLLSPMLFLVFVLRLKVLGLIVEPLFMTEGGPVNSTMTYGLRAYYDFFRNDDVGYASAWFVMLAVFSVIVAVIAGRRMRRNQVMV